MKGVGQSILGLLLLVTGLGGCHGHSPKSAKTTREPIRYEVVQQWAIPAGGYGRVTVVDSSHRNEADMRRLGDQLREQTQGDRVSMVEVYDHPEAAKMRLRAMAENLGKDSLAFHDRHLIGQYLRNGNTGHHRWIIALNGFVNDPTIMVDY